jgi:hypothetical protein
MKLDDALKAAQQRADRTRKRMAVYSLLGTNDYSSTPDRDDLPDDWVVVALVDPKSHTFKQEAP